ncbi:MAG: hypothetical protein M1824_002345 [Vezdaea acicularis]|nr:MAG: hypothetical protein M1824_002345 [Vezdaea acicularis]
MPAKEGRAPASSSAASSSERQAQEGPKPSEFSKITITDSEQRSSIQPQRRANSASPASKPPPLHLTTTQSAATTSSAVAGSKRQLEASISSPKTPSSAGIAEPASNICICAPERKVPRPRNAFMLYRQHFQSAIVAQNPGLANPEVSKIIGKQWREEPAEVREQWDSLAEEEKSRHNQQYPDYKYQPKRKSKKALAFITIPNAADGPTDEANHPMCEKCGKRVRDPNTPVTPFTPQQTSIPRSSMSTPRYIPSVNTPRTPFPRTRPWAGYGTLHHSSDMGLPQISPFKSSFRNSTSSGELPPTSPDPKRRRLSTNLPYPSPVRSESPLRIQHGMGPPPRPPYTSTSSVTLPPIRTSPLSSPFDGTQPRSIEAMIKTIPVINKIRLLSKVSPPLAAPSTSPPNPKPRGCIVAIDGEDESCIATVTAYLEKTLRTSGECAIHNLAEPKPDTPRERTTLSPNSPASVPLAGYPPRHIETPRNSSIHAYLLEISEWHALTPSLISYITRAPSPPPTPSSGISPKTVAPPVVQAESPKTPVLLIPGYQLTRANAFASSAPIKDNYSALDHWQWAATLWRGVVGPDVVVWVGGVAGKREGPDEGDGSGSGDGENVGESGQRTRQGGEVEVKNRERNGVGAVLIKRGDGEGREIEERVLRRVGFEVGEMVRVR